TGRDILYGGEHPDVFVVSALGSANVDRVADFERHDALDLRLVLAAYDPHQDRLDDFVSIERSGGDYVLTVDVDGAGRGHGFAQALLITANGETAALDQGLHALVD